MIFNIDSDKVVIESKENPLAAFGFTWLIFISKKVNG
jgi:hypothetical protein